ncbi:MULTISPECIES: peptide MFS transporter [Limosilactobacillus]|uniref:Di-tripeptide transporter n=1 Tax=Limosilactobacillus panis DSM 6035 TaxID=1423782 RepID=A0A0R1XKS4_9LACO|nr:peptide MFS transporter [Limosilactobacillus panis]KRM28932.1 di- tripeptide transporter [Limosilactobacillus panis DSM 6035]
MGRQRNIDTAFFGQPRGLSTLFFTEMWERFSYYGMRAILIFYMYYAVTKGGLGFNQVTAASIMSIYGSLVYLSSVIGGWLSDHIWGSRRTVFYGGVLIMFGHIALSLPFGRWGLFTSIALIVMGTGLLKPNVSEMVGSLYSDEDSRRASGFSLYLFGINLGAAVAPWAVPWAADGFGLGLFHGQMNFHAGFSLAAVGMFFGLVQYLIDGRKYLPSVSLKPEDPLKAGQGRPVINKTVCGVVLLAIILGVMGLAGKLTIANVIMLITIVAILLPIYYFVLMLHSKKVTKIERARVRAYIPLFFAAVIFWIIDESGSVVLALFAAQRTVLHIGSWHFAAANFQTLNPLFMMILTPLFAVLWDHLKKRPSAPAMFALALVFAGLSYAFMALPGLIHGTTAGRVSPFWLVGSWFIVELGEVTLSPVGLSITSSLAPQAFKSQMMSMYFLADAAGQAVNAQIVKFYSSATEVPYFLTIGTTSIAFGILLFFFVKKIRSLTEE